MKDNIVEGIDNEFVRVRLEKGIIHITYKKGPITKDIAKKIVKSRIELANFEDTPVFIDDMGVGGDFDREAREYMGRAENTVFMSAVGFYFKSVINRYLAKFFVKISDKSSNFPTKFFADRNEAIEWLKKFVK